MFGTLDHVVHVNPPPDSSVLSGFPLDLLSLLTLFGLSWFRKLTFTVFAHKFRLRAVFPKTSSLLCDRHFSCSGSIKLLQSNILSVGCPDKWPLLLFFRRSASFSGNVLFLFITIEPRAAVTKVRQIAVLLKFYQSYLTFFKCKILFSEALKVMRPMWLEFTARDLLGPLLGSGAICSPISSGMSLLWDLDQETPQTSVIL